MSHCRVALAFLLAAACAPAAAAGVRSTHAEAELISAQTALVPGATVELGLRIALDPEWHVYWKNPGDSGNAPTLTPQLPQGFSASAMAFPYPRRIPVAHLVNFGFEGEVLFPVEVRVPAGLREGTTITLRARADWLECREICLPASADLALDLPVAAQARASRWAELFERTHARMPVALTSGASAVATDGGVELRIAGLAHCTNGDFFPDREGVFTHARIRRIAAEDGAMRFALPLEDRPPDEVAGVATCVERGTATRAYTVSASVARFAPGVNASVALSLSVALVFAFVGGLALNLMPCVFPVLGLKALGLARISTQERATRLRHAGAFTFGLVASFLALAGAMLALRAAGEQIGWGFQLQSPWFVSALAVLFFVLALNLSGFFEWGGAIQAAVGSAARRLGGPFFDGALAALVASPCTAPLMGAAVGYTLAEPAPVVLAVFGALGLGMATPYALLALNPGWARRLPKPGPWLESVKQLLAFPLYATALWLAWVLGELVSHTAAVRLAVLMLAVTFSIWLWRQRRARALAIATSVVALAGSALWLHAALDAPASKIAALDGFWRPYSRAALDDLRAQGKPVFVDFTAAWCVTCQVNKQAVLGSDAVVRALRESETVAVRADWTRRDPEITRALAELGRNGVPVYAVYGRAGGVTILPEILTAQLVIDALKGASR